MDIRGPGAKYDSGDVWGADEVNFLPSTLSRRGERPLPTEEGHSGSVGCALATPFVCVWRGICQIFSWIVSLFRKEGEVPVANFEGGVTAEQLSIYNTLQKWSQTHVTRGDQKGYLRKKYAESRLQQMRIIRSNENPYVLNLNRYLFDPLTESIVGRTSGVYNCPEDAFEEGGSLCRRLEKATKEYNEPLWYYTKALPSGDNKKFGVKKWFTRLVQTKEFKAGGLSRKILYDQVCTIVSWIESLPETEREDILTTMGGGGCQDFVVASIHDMMQQIAYEKSRSDVVQVLSLMVLRHKRRIVEDHFTRGSDPLESVLYHQILLNPIGLCVLPSGTWVNDPSQFMYNTNIVAKKASFQEALDEICPYFTLNHLEDILNQNNDWMLHLRDQSGEEKFENRQQPDGTYEISDLTREALEKTRYATMDLYYELPDDLLE